MKIMSKNFQYELWDIPNNKWELKEDYLNESSNKSVADGRNILAVVQGVFFVPDGVSRNERYYPKIFWETIIGHPDLRRRLDDKVMFGCIGHEDRGITESDITDGKVSHIVTKLWIDEETKMGMGEAYILGTPAGRNLYVVMKAGSRIKVSSLNSGENSTVVVVFSCFIGIEILSLTGILKSSIPGFLPQYLIKAILG